MQSIGYAQKKRTTRAAELWLAMIVIAAALLIAVAAWGAVATNGRADLPQPVAGHSLCMAGAVRGPCS
jgi:hypothetical protein